MTTGWKALTHDWRPPLQGGEPLCDGTTWPVILPTVQLDTSEADCAPGWHYCERLSDALSLAGLWPTGYSSRVVLVDAEGIRRGDKSRAASLTLIREATDEEIREGVTELSAPFGPHQDRIAEAQLLWRRSLLLHPTRDRAAVVAGLTAALAARGLPWHPQEYPDARAAWNAWNAWNARAAWDAWDARAAWNARAAWDAWNDRAAWAAWAAWVAWSAGAGRAVWNARAELVAWTAWDAWNALGQEYAALMRWSERPAELLTTGIRDAYAAGLAVALPTGPTTLGWAMIP